MKPIKGINLKENRILIQRFSKEEKSAGGIILPESEQEAPEGGTIVAAGPLVEDLKVGEKVRFYEHGTEVTHNGKDYYLARSSDVWAGID
jgi:chaperonin GroES